MLVFGMEVPLVELFLSFLIASIVLLVLSIAMFAMSFKRHRAGSSRAASPAKRVRL
jgi:hypothetical protein